MVQSPGFGYDPEGGADWREASNSDESTISSDTVHYYNFRLVLHTTGRTVIHDLSSVMKSGGDVHFATHVM